MNLRRAVMPLVSLTLLLCCAAGLRGQAYTQIVVFGDSLSETGNFARLSANAYGLRIPGPVAGYTDGRFTDGLDTAPPAQMYTGVWVEQMAATLAAKPAVKASLDGGTNYGYGSATNGPGTQVVTFGPGNLLSVTVQNIGAQIATYLATKPAITNKTLFVVWGGANDLLQATTPAQIATAAGLDAQNVQTLITAGATDFLIPNLPPLGAIPRLNGMAAMAAQATAAAQAYNGALAAQLGGLAAANPGKTLHLYQVDIYSLFNSILASPAVLGLANDTQMSQGVAVNPDTYLFWDDLHPTTYGHYLISRLAENLLTETTAAGTTLSLGATAAVPGQTVSLKAVVAVPGGPVPVSTPTGLVTFYSGSTPVATAVLDSSGTATASLAAGPVSGSPYAITARYSGDGVYYANTSAAQNVTVVATPVATTTTLSASSANVNLGSGVTLTATVSSAVGVPTGTVTFQDGMAVLGTGTLTAGTTSSTATLTTSLLAAGPHSITASYVAGTTYAASSSAAVAVTVVAPGYTFAASPSSLTIASGASGTTTLTVTPVGGLTGTYTLACGTLPAHFSCSFAPSSVVLAGAAQSSTLTIATNVATGALRMPARPGTVPSLPVYAGLLALPGVAMLGWRRRMRRLGLVAALLLGAGGMLGLSGCAKSSNNAAAGTYTVPVTLTPAVAGGSVGSLNVTVVVQ